ncbi:hypothetical protein BD560DRAFT_393889 [Blakeslea trispora]|nr:hypothetical protein BD560DRAFT_393889 [Blakeslea trispora]
MDDTLLQFEESLEALEKQRESLEIAMREMGAECSESEINHGWLTNFSLNLNSTSQLKEDTNNKNFTGALPTPLFHLIQSSNAGPSHDYLQTLLNVNEEILAQSLAASNSSAMIDDTHDSPEPHFVTQQNEMPALAIISPPLSHNEVPVNPTQLFTPPITPPEEH